MKTVKQTRIAEAQAAWDSIDIEQVRNVAWSAVPYFMERNFVRMGGPNPLVILRRLLRERAPEADRLSLVGGVLLCGDMRGEACFFEPQTDLAFAEVDGFDLSPASLARFVPEDFAFTGRVADCNDLVLEADRYDLLVGHHGIHHVMNLGGLFHQAHKSLRESGLLFFDEWVGPPHLQIPARNGLFARLLLFVLFPGRASRTNHMGQVKGLWLQAPPEAFDPSEACNAEDLVPQYRRYFEPLAEVGYGGLTYPVFEGLGHKIDLSRRSDRLRVRVVYWLERLLTRLRLVRPLFVTSIGAPRARPGRQSASARP